jgi:hypothetical protein
VAVAVVCAAGCQLNFKPGAESLFEALNSETPPRELAEMAIDQYDANNRARGTLGLANAYFADEPVYVRLFEDNIQDPDPAVRAAAARGLANHGQPSHAVLLVAALRDPEKMVRLEAARGLQRLHSPDAAAPLIQAMREPDIRGGGEPEAQVRAAAADALGQYATLPVLEALIAALDDPDLAVNRSALKSLNTLTGQDLGIERAAWVQWRGRMADPFAGRRMYEYPAFNRPYRWWEYLPLVPKPPNEVPGPPAGLPRG